MNTQDPFIEQFRSNLNDFNGQAEQRVQRQRKARRNRIVRKVALAIVSVAVGIGTGTAIVNATQADAATQTQINRFIRSEGGIPPCTHEDGSGQAGTCVWWAKQRGNGDGHSYLAVPDGRDKGDDDDLIYITGPKAERY